MIRALGDGIVAQAGDEGLGLLYVTLVTEQTGEERRGTVCGPRFNVEETQLFCKNMGHHVEEGRWGKSTSYRHIPQ